MSESVTVVRVETGWECELRERGLRARIHVADANGALAVTEVNVSTESGEDVAASALSRAPYATWMRAAKDAVNRQRSRGRLKRASDLYLTPFLEEGRGKARRTDADFANLAFLYVMRGKARHGLARELATRYGGSIQTWRNRLTQAKRFTETVESFDEDGNPYQDVTVTDEGLRLIFGDDYAAAFELEARRDQAYVGAAEFIRLREDPRTSAERARVTIEDRNRTPDEVERLLARARQIRDA